MNQTEFIFRYSNMPGLKLNAFLKYLLPNLSEHKAVDEKHLFHLLNFSSEQIRIFYQINTDVINQWLESEQNHLICYNDDAYPELLRQIHSPPLILYVKGNKNVLKFPQLAMVGSRNFSEYGAQWARYFAHELSINGLTITSGLALGIDAICHRGALEAQGNTIAVLGSGLLNISPKTNLSLANDILVHNGAIISEFKPDELPRSEYFPRRNRIISGLSLGAFIIEANLKSGSLITAKYALEQNRDVFALPGDIDHSYSAGTHQLIKQGAYLVSEPNDILEHYQQVLNVISISQSNSVKINQIMHTEVYTLLSTRPMPADLIAQKLNLPINEITVKLVELELTGLITTVNGGYIKNAPY